MISVCRGGAALSDLVARYRGVDPVRRLGNRAGGNEHRSRSVRPADAGSDERSEGDRRGPTPDGRPRIAHAGAGLVHLWQTAGPAALFSTTRCQGAIAHHGAANATAWAENVASWSPGTGRDAASVFGLYMNSPGHKVNILNPILLFVGIGTVINGANVGFNTQNFTNRIDQTAPPAALPIGHVDSMTVVGTTVVVRGWADDPADSSLSSTAMITVGTVSRVVTANWPRRVNAAQSITGQHGLMKTMSIGVGTRVGQVVMGGRSSGCFDVSRT